MSFIESFKTPYDDVYRTMLQECKALIIPVINEIFKTDYSGKEKIISEENELFISGENYIKKKITDSSFSINKNFISNHYHLECQSTSDGSMIVRMYEYDSQIALKHSEINDCVLNIRFPKSAVLYLRHNEKTPDVMTIKIITSGGSVSYEVPILKIKYYDIDTIFAKNLLFLIPFYIFTYEDYLPQIENDEERLYKLKKEYSDIVNKLDCLCKRGIITEYIYKTICHMAEIVVMSLAKKYENIRKGVVSIMGGEVLDYEAKRIKDKALAEGIALGRAEVLSEILSEYIEWLKEMGKKETEIINEIMEKFKLTESEAKEYFRECLKVS